jgi:hypothetical protein
MHPGSELIPELLAEVQSRDVPLSQCIAEALTVVQGLPNANSMHFAETNWPVGK